MTTLNAAEGGKKLAAAMAQAAEGERVILEQDGKPIAAIVSIEDAEFMEKLEDEYWGRKGQAALDEFQASGERAVSWEQIKAELGL